MIPRFSPVDFISFYLELPVMVLMYIGWLLLKRPVQRSDWEESRALISPTSATPLLPRSHRFSDRSFHDLVDTLTVDLRRDEYEEAAVDKADDELRERRLHGRVQWLWTLYYWIV